MSMSVTSRNSRSPKRVMPTGDCDSAGSGAGRARVPTNTDLRREKLRTWQLSICCGVGRPPRWNAAGLLDTDIALRSGTPHMSGWANCIPSHQPQLQILIDASLDSWDAKCAIRWSIFWSAQRFVERDEEFGWPTSLSYVRHLDEDQKVRRGLQAQAHVTR